MLAPPPLSPQMQFCTKALAEANINPSSFLATDYLNHFNEVVMLMEMVPDMPDMVEEVLAWQPRGYAEHFDQSVFAAKALAMQAYKAAPVSSREPFDAVINDLNGQIEDIQIMLSGVDMQAAIDPALADRLMLAIVNDIRPAIDRASSIINASHSASQIAPVPSEDEAKMRAQDAIDEMFA